MGFGGIFRNVLGTAAAPQGAKTQGGLMSQLTSPQAAQAPKPGLFASIFGGGQQPTQAEPANTSTVTPTPVARPFGGGIAPGATAQPFNAAPSATPAPTPNAGAMGALRGKGWMARFRR
jgi:hypothetical protein